jgi:hypothetical protein
MTKMKLNIKRRWPFGVVLICALVALGITASAVFGGTTQPTQPAEPAGEAQAVAPAADYVQSGPRLTQTQIEEVAQHEAARAGDATPGDATDTATMTTVDTSLLAAAEASPHTTAMHASSPGMESLLKSEVVVVVMHGQFEFSSAPVPKGQPEPTGTVMTLAIDSHSGWVDQRELTTSEAPGLKALGTPVPAEIAG